MAKRDYYEILGLKPGAAEAEIKKAYRDLAKRNHPDARPGDKAAEERFKEISEAYYVLGDAKKRAEYDAFRSGGGFGRSGGGAYGGFQGAQGFDFDEILRAFRGSGAAGGAKARYSTAGSFRGFEDLFGSFGTPGAEEVESVEADTRATLKISRQRAQKGGEVSFATREGKKITVKIPAGIVSGSKLRLSRQGRECPTCRHNGDLILTVQVE
ncbi:MAG: Curved DNA-binding protein [Candidatus Omnitrophica bacterium]|nr:Curved DNA-binding protein [Candidatus Omnitrophota bacterium]